MTAAERLEQVTRDNEKLIERNRELDAELSRCKQALGKCGRVADEMARAAPDYGTWDACEGTERSIPDEVLGFSREIKSACAEAGAEPPKPEDVTTVSAYDLISEEDRETLRWVKYQGGLQVMKNLADVCDMLRKRVVPEGYEWPRYEDGKPVMLGDTVTKYVGGGTIKVRSVEFLENMTYLHERFKPDQIAIVRPGERVKRPEVLASDGEPLEVGQTVWLVDSFGRPDKEREVSEILRHDRDLSCTIIKFTDGYSTDCGNVTHERPVLDADGVPIKVGDTVYLLPGEWCDEFPCCGVHSGDELEVFADGEPEHVPGGVQCNRKGIRYLTCYPQPSQLTHTKPEPPDSWGKLYDDMCPRDDGMTFEEFERRCKAMAGRDAS